MTARFMFEFNDLTKDITPEDMPNDDLRLVAEVMSVEMALLMMRDLGGLTISIPKNGFWAFRKKFILKNRGKMTPKQMAIKLGASQSWVYKVLEELEE